MMCHCHLLPISSVNFQGLTAVTMKMTLFWDVALCFDRHLKHICFFQHTNVSDLRSIRKSNVEHMKSGDDCLQGPDVLCITVSYSRGKL